jgi:hypothetical protein
LSVSPLIHGSCGGKCDDALIALMKPMSIGFSVFHTSGAKEASSTPST